MLEEETEDDDDLDLEPALARSSFFAPNEADDPGSIVHYDEYGEDDYVLSFHQDRLVCTDVWRIYMRSSAEHGHATDAESHRELWLATSADTVKRKQRIKHAMSHVEMKEGEMGYGNVGLAGRVKEVHPRLKKELGRAPTAKEVVRAIEADGGAATPTGVAKSMQKGGLDYTSDRNRVGTKRVSARARAPSSQKPMTAMVRTEPEASPPSGGTGALLAIMALQAQRAKVAAQLEAIDRVIDNLRQ